MMISIKVVVFVTVRSKHKVNECVPAIVFLTCIFIGEEKNTSN